MNYGYIRVSSDKQTVENQRYEIMNFAKSQNIQIDGWIEETISGTKTPDKRKLGRLLQNVNEGDKIICSELSRLGRSLYMIMNILSLCMEKKVIIQTIKDNFILKDDINSKVLAFAFGLAAEVERTMIADRTRTALQLRKAQGKHIGRPKGALSKNGKLSPHEEVIRTLIEQDNTYAEVARLFHVDRSTLKRFCDNRGIKRPNKRNDDFSPQKVATNRPITDNKTSINQPSTPNYTTITI